MTPQQMNKYDDLLLQSLMFDMDIDWETAQLIPKKDNTDPQWLIAYRERMKHSDKQQDYITQNWDGTE